MAEIPAPEYSISTTPKLLTSTATTSASSPRNVFFAAVFVSTNICFLSFLWNLCAILLSKFCGSSYRDQPLCGWFNKHHYNRSKSYVKGQIYILAQCSNP
jgi:hypothetical protein